MGHVTVEGFFPSRIVSIVPGVRTQVITEAKLETRASSMITETPNNQSQIPSSGNFTLMFVFQKMSPNLAEEWRMFLSVDWTQYNQPVQVQPIVYLFVYSVTWTVEVVLSIKYCAVHHLTQALKYVFTIVWIDYRSRLPENSSSPILSSRMEPSRKLSSSWYFSSVSRFFLRTLQRWWSSELIKDVI